MGRVIQWHLILTFSHTLSYYNIKSFQFEATRRYSSWVFSASLIFCPFLLLKAKGKWSLLLLIALLMWLVWAFLSHDFVRNFAKTPKFRFRIKYIEITIIIIDFEDYYNISQKIWSWNWRKLNYKKKNTHTQRQHLFFVCFYIDLSILCYSISIVSLISFHPKIKTAIAMLG